VSRIEAVVAWTVIIALVWQGWMNAVRASENHRAVEALDERVDALEARVKDLRTVEQEP
jgi:cell division protein FtsB